MVVICDASDIIKYDRRTRELSDEPLHVTQETTSIAKCNPNFFNLKKLL